ncbi:MAG: hypothetical protein M3169_00405 [Candidatus Eremiobacteraeota bacterium]|nr:hypothetical protein [Candidatus Eremiobacteraeota bacterium]
MADVSRELLVLGMLRRAPLSAYDNHAFNRVRAEQRFLAESIAQLRDAKWSPSWTSDDGLIDADRRLQARADECL